jgi:hypothetical protein
VCFERPDGLPLTPFLKGLPMTFFSAIAADQLVELDLQALFQEHGQITAGLPQLLHLLRRQSTTDQKRQSQRPVACLRPSLRLRKIAISAMLRRPF